MGLVGTVSGNCFGESSSLWCKQKLVSGRVTLPSPELGVSSEGVRTRRRSLALVFGWSMAGGKTGK